MSTWTEQAGYPVVNVMKKDKSLVLTQVRITQQLQQAINFFLFLATLFIQFYRVK